jgi:hypothetical protein
MSEVIRRKTIKLGALALVFALVTQVGAEPGNDNRAPDLGDCQKLQVEEGNKVAFVAYAEGVQIYQWSGTKWEFVAPEAILYTGNGQDDGVIGGHYAGPTWQSVSGSKVVATPVDKCTADPDAIPWLLLKKVSTEGPGIFENVSFIQRVFTAGGLAPVDAGDYIGEEARVPYSAWYVFYREQR